MIQCNSLDIKLSNSQLNKLKLAIKNETEVVLRLSSNMIGDNETNFPHKLLLTNRQVANIHKAFANHSWPITKNRITRLAKSVLIPSGLTAATAGADAGIHKNLRIREYENANNIK